MATVLPKPYRTAFAVASTNLYLLGDPAYDTVGSLLITVESASSLSATARGAAPGATLDTSSGQLQYSDLSAAGTVAAGATAITANGNYVVRADGCLCGLHVTAGTATVTVVPLRG